MESLALASRLLSSWLKPSLPSYLIYFVTARCNARCEMCFYWRELEAVRRRLPQAVLMFDKFHLS